MNTFQAFKLTHQYFSVILQKTNFLTSYCCDLAYIGAPFLRQNLLWPELVEKTLQAFEYRGLRVVLENICVGDCSLELLSHYSGLTKVDTNVICVDIANYASCNNLREQFDNLFMSAQYVHLSGPDHTFPTPGDFDFWEKQQIARSMGKRITYEFLGSEIPEICQNLKPIMSH